eukprot:maker-scaffold1073_size64583-snap-gene-0.7 protein:Tk02398 transcript:maker-scaffold1073_size64583-snap-gene-0.7-mRNA-1 annotation:"unnamed protein product"
MDSINKFSPDDCCAVTWKGAMAGPIEVGDAVPSEDPGEGGKILVTTQAQVGAYCLNPPPELEQHKQSSFDHFSIAGVVSKARHDQVVIEDLSCTLYHTHTSAMLNSKSILTSTVILVLELIQPVPAPVPRCSPLIIINKLAESTNILSDSNPYFPVPPCEYGGWTEALAEGDFQAVSIFAEPQKIPLHNFYEFIWLLKTGGPRMFRMLTGEEEFKMNRQILNEGYHHHTPHVRTQQFGQYTHRNPIIIDDKNTYKVIVGNRIKAPKDKHPNHHYTYQGGRIPKGGKKGKKGGGGGGHHSGGGGHHSSGYGAPQHQSSGYGAPQQQSSGYGAPSTGSGYGAPSTGSGYGAPSTGSGYGAPSTGSGYGAPATGSGYGAPSTGSGYGAPSTGSGYGAPSTGSGYGAPSTGAGYSAPQVSSGYAAPHGGSFKRDVGGQAGAASSVIVTANNNGLTESTFDAVPIEQANAASASNIANPFLRRKKHITANDFDTTAPGSASLTFVEDAAFVPSNWPQTRAQRPSASKHGITTYFDSIANNRASQRSQRKIKNVHGSPDGSPLAHNDASVGSGRAAGPYFFAQRSGKEPSKTTSKGLLQGIKDLFG